MKNISYFTLGTVQIGLKYGISNKNGMPAREEALSILSAAFNRGVNSFDTSFSYGTSEEVIGAFIEGNKNVRNRIIINSKMPKIEISGEKGIYDKVKEYIISSRDKLKVDVIDTYMMHDAGDISSFEGKVVKNLIRVKEEGLIGEIGVSVYYPDEALKILDIDEIKVIQIPFNVFDTRFFSSGVIEKLKEAKKTIFARSIFLQGLFFLDGEELSDTMPEAVPYVKKLAELAGELNYGIDELAVKFARSFPEIDSLVLGAETVSQVERNASLVMRNGVTEEQRDRMMEIFSDVPECVYLPTLWRK